MGEFFACFAALEDPRENNARHDLHELLLIALCAVLCGAEDCSDMALFGRSKEAFFRTFLDLQHGIPSHDTFSRVFRMLDPGRSVRSERSDSSQGRLRMFEVFEP